MRSLLTGLSTGLVIAACGSSAEPPQSTATPGLIFHYPAAGQLDVPLGTRVVVSFTTGVDEGALGSCAGVCIEGPDGPLDATATVGSDGLSVSFEGADFEPGTRYQVVVGSALSPAAENLPTSGPLFGFTTRAKRPRVALPTLIAINGVDPSAEVGAPFFDSGTIRLTFSEPLDPRPIAMVPGSIELVDVSNGMSLPATLIASGIHVSIDPLIDLNGGQTVEVRLGDRLTDLGGRALAPTTITLTAQDTHGTTGPIAQTLRTRLEGDRGPKRVRSGSATNVIVMDKPLIGREELRLGDSALTAELGDPKALGGPIAFTIRRGQRLVAGSLDVKLGGEIPAGLTTGDILIEFLTDANGRIYRNPYQDPAQPPDETAPLFVDLTFDVAVSATDPIGNAVLTQTILGVRASGTAVATDGVLAIETVASMELGLLGVTEAPTNLVLELVTDPTRVVPPDQSAPTLVATYPASGANDFSVGNAIEITFNEPIDIGSAQRGGIRLEDNVGLEVASTYELHGSVLVVRPLGRLLYGTGYNLVVGNLTDVAGNAITGSVIPFATPPFEDTDVPLTLIGVNPGVPCALTDGDATTPGRCDAGDDSDDLYAPFVLAADEDIEAVFSQPFEESTIVLGAACDSGSVRIELLDGGGNCVSTVPGTFLVRERSFQFIADQPWEVGQTYRLALISGDNDNCNDDEICGLNDEAASFDPLDGHEDNDAGGTDLIIDFTATEAIADTFLFSDAYPASDVNGSGFIEGGEILRDSNRAAMRIKAVEGDVDEATFDMDDCIPETSEVDGCMYLLGAMPVTMGELERDCTLPSGQTAPACIPVFVRPQVMYATSMAMDADAGVSISTETGTNIMRVREPPGGVRGVIIDDGGTPTMIVDLELYMDAPDMSIILTDHDLHSKPLSLKLRGPVSFLSDGRIVINLANTEAVDVRVAIDGPFGIDGTIVLELPVGAMKLQLLSRPARGLER